MRIAKYLLLLLLLLSIAFVVFVATQPNEFDISEEKTIKSPKSKVFNFINDFENWGNWHPELINKQGIKSSFSKLTSGEGAFIDWDGNRISTSKVFEQDSIYQIEKIDDQNYTTYWTFREENNQTKITWGIKGHLTFKEKMKALLTGSNETKFSSLLTSGLENINNYLVNEFSTFNVIVNGIITREASSYIQQRDSCKISDFQVKAATLLKNINLFVKQNEITTTGDSYIQFKTWDETNDYVVYTACVPIQEEILTTPLSDIRGGYYESFIALKTTLKGDYNHRKEALKKALEFIAENNYIEEKKGEHIEIYKVNNSTTTDKIKPSQFITEILIPVIKKNVTPVVVKQNVEIPVDSISK